MVTTDTRVERLNPRGFMRMIAAAGLVRPTVALHGSRPWPWRWS